MPPVVVHLEALEERWLLAGLSYFPSAVGFGAGATGGEAGPVVVADTAAEFRTFAQQNGPRTIRVQGMLDVGIVSIKSNLTIVGDGNDGLIGELRLSGVRNVILQNLKVTNPDGDGGGDAIVLVNANTVWMDHLEVYDAPDGLIDITNASDNVTVSWSKFHYTASDPPGHNFAMLIGSNDTDTQDRGKLHVTLHHNWWGARVHERMPRARFGDVHVFNSYFNAPGNLYGIRAAIESEVLLENNTFESVNDPHVVYVTTGVKGRIEARGNLYVNTTGRRDGGADVFNPPYAYTLESASSVKSSVTAGAGVKTLPATKFFVVDDASAGRTFEYTSAGRAIETYALAAANSNPRDAVSRLAGDRVWVINDAVVGADTVYVYDAAGALLGSWTPRTATGANLTTPEGIATDGSTIWIVDDGTNTVYRYSGAAGRTSGAVNATSSFPLTGANSAPKGVATDGKNLWVVNSGAPDRVYRYSLSGSLTGSWAIDARNTSPTGITVDPSNVSHLWIVDSGTDSVYQYSAAATRTSGSQSAASVFRLASGNANPQGIADPPPATGDSPPPAQPASLPGPGDAFLAHAAALLLDRASRAQPPAAPCGIRPAPRHGLNQKLRIEGASSASEPSGGLADAVPICPAT